jgi:CheY-like chemotaxis protein
MIGLSGNALISDHNEFLAAGVDDFYTKPMSRSHLVSVLEEYGLLTTQQQEAKDDK